MIKGLLTDVVSTVRYFGQVRQRRKNTIKIPVYELKPAFYNTVEGCCLSNCGRQADAAGRLAFRSMTYEQQRAMEFSPKTGEFTERANLWREALRQVAPGKYGHAAMVGILSWYRHIKQMRRN